MPGDLCETNVFKNLSGRLTDIANRLRGRGRLSEGNLRDAVRDVRRALLEADVALPVVRGFIEQVKQRALGQEVAGSISPGQAFIKILHDELVTVLGGGSAALNLRQQPPAIIMLVGLQGAGKTTTAAKLARFLAERDQRKVMLASLDTRRPAAMLQLQQLAAQIGAPCLQIEQASEPATIASRAIDEARRGLADVLILDTAGRTRLEADLLDELSALHELTAPAETLFVIDSMAGQDAVHAAQSFSDAVPLTGLILTKVDGDARGGVALSASEVTTCPIK
ncbi:MAG: signal recognition particle receptor subunit alpha, partial [Gammaproteobacteria bacterium]